MKTVEQEEMVESRPTKIANEIYVYVNENRFIHLINCYLYPGSDDIGFGHPDNYEIFDNELYFTFNLNYLKRIKNIRFKDSLFIENSFIKGYDRNGKLYLRSVPRTRKEYVIEPINDHIEIIGLK